MAVPLWAIGLGVGGIKAIADSAREKRQRRLAATKQALAPLYGLAPGEANIQEADPIGTLFQGAIGGATLQNLVSPQKTQLELGGPGDFNEEALQGGTAADFSRPYSNQPSLRDPGAEQGPFQTTQNQFTNPPSKYNSFSLLRREKSRFI